MKIAIIQFPGSNCERETSLAVKRAGMEPVDFLWNEDPSLLEDMDGYIIVGGFSYEDRSRAGIIAALDPVMQSIRQQSELGKPVLGICNGAQILVETGMVPGLANDQLGMALTDNKRMAEGKVLGTGFYNAWIHMQANPKASNNAFTRHMGKEVQIRVPIAHAEGRFVIPAELLAEVEANGLNVFQYTDEQGVISNEFPTNPNGSVANTAAIMNKRGNVMAMMPHPERTEAGDVIFSSMRDYIQEGKPTIPQKLEYKPSRSEIPLYKKESNKQELLVQLIITDNFALTVQNTLRQKGLPVRVSRMIHWQLDNAGKDALKQIKESGLLYNERKEFLVPPFDLDLSKERAFLVRAKDDFVGMRTLQRVAQLGVAAKVDAIHHGTLWLIHSEEGSIEQHLESIFNSNILFNPYAHECYHYEY